MNEQTSSHVEAADNYEKAWKYSRKNQPSIGKVSFAVLAESLANTLFVHKARIFCQSRSERVIQSVRIISIASLALVNLTCCQLIPDSESFSFQRNHRWVESCSLSADKINRRGDNHRRSSHWCETKHEILLTRYRCWFVFVWTSFIMLIFTSRL